MRHLIHLIEIYRFFKIKLHFIIANFYTNSKNKNTYSKKYIPRHERKHILAENLFYKWRGLGSSIVN